MGGVSTQLELSALTSNGALSNTVYHLLTPTTSLCRSIRAVFIFPDKVNKSEIKGKGRRREGSSWKKANTQAGAWRSFPSTCLKQNKTSLPKKKHSLSQEYVAERSSEKGSKHATTHIGHAMRDHPDPDVCTTGCVPVSFHDVSEDIGTSEMDLTTPTVT
nr:hypothetical protein L203_05218 [Cryptococcus depauperatus CBS 7841]